MKAEWFVAWVETGREEEAVQRIEALRRPIETLCPTQELWRRRKGEWQLTRQLIFPGYVFLHCKMHTGVYYAIKGLPGVLGWLGSDSLWPSTVRQEEMDVVLALAQGVAPGSVLGDPQENKRQRRGYGTLTIQGREYRIPYNIYESNKQAEALPGDASPEEEPKPMID